MHIGTVEIKNEIIGWSLGRAGERASLYGISNWQRVGSEQLQPPTSVDEFLFLNPDLVPVVKEARARLTNAFGQSCRVSEKLFFDREETEPEAELFLVANVDMDSDEAFDILERLEDEWWSDQFDKTDGKVHLTYRHRQG